MQEISSSLGGKKGIIAVFYKEEVAAQVQKILATENLLTIQLPEEDGLPKELIVNLEKDNDDLTKKVADVKNELEEWNAHNGSMLLGGMELLERDLGVHTAPVKVAVSEHAFVIEGWVLTDNADKSKKLLSEVKIYKMSAQLHHRI